MWFRHLAVVIAGGIAISGAASAEDSTGSPTGAIYACAAITIDAERLACFDSAVADLRSKEQAGVVQTIDVAKIQEIEKEAFGFAMPSLPKLFNRSAEASGGSDQEAIEEITVAVKSARIQGVTGRVIVVLENGQTWEQIDTAKVNSYSLRKAKEARVKKAALGSFMMSIDGGRAFRVKRTS